MSASTYRSISRPSPISPDTNEQYAQRDFEKHGFELVSTSDVLRRPDDPRELIAYKGEMVGKTDRFVMVFRRQR